MLREIYKQYKNNVLGCLSRISAIDNRLECSCILKLSMVLTLYQLLMQLIRKRKILLEYGPDLLDMDEWLSICLDIQRTDTNAYMI